jgi:hypothetical protein
LMFLHMFLRLSALGDGPSLVFSLWSLVLVFFLPLTAYCPLPT